MSLVELRASFKIKNNITYIHSYRKQFKGGTSKCQRPTCNR